MDTKVHHLATVSVTEKVNDESLVYKRHVYSLHDAKHIPRSVVCRMWAMYMGYNKLAVSELYMYVNKISDVCVYGNPSPLSLKHLSLQ